MADEMKVRENINNTDKILKFIKASSGDYVSGTMISRTLRISRNAVWKHIKKLRDIGYDVDASSKLGYRFIGVSNDLISDEISSKVKTRNFGKKVIFYKTIDSTNSIVYDLADKGLQEGSVIIADEQKMGRGRRGRIWLSPSGAGIYMSLLLRPKMLPSEISKITLVAAVSVARAINSFTGLYAKIKWPNDILINGKKVCGILTEMKAENDGVDFLVLGIGVNVNTDKTILPHHATSLVTELRADDFACNTISRTDLICAILESLEKYYICLKKGCFASIIKEWKDMSCMLNQRVKVSLHGKDIFAIAVDVDNEGFLMVRLDSGKLVRITSGDVEIRG